MHWYASQPNYAAHMVPIRDALPAEMRGELFGMPRAQWSTERTPPNDGTPVVVASGVDAQRFANRPVIYIEHGSGQAYRGDPVSASSPSYAGGDGLGNVVLFVCPSQAVADRWADRYPNATTAVVGCPRLDRHWPPTDRVPGIPRVAFAFHWECKLVPETRSAWKHWREAVVAYVQSEDRAEQVAGHAHPRAGEIQSSMQSFGVRIIDDVDDMLDWCDVLICDNSSVLFEACAIGKQTIVLNAPWYRRGIEHGMRFWSAVPGPMIDEPGQLRGMIRSVLADDGYATLRRDAAEAAYGSLVDGHASARAAAAIAAV